MSNIYEVILDTPVGKRFGKMNVLVQGQNITGMLHILKVPEPFEGIVESNGQCRITGNLSTLMRRIPYMATGVIGEQIALELVSGQERFWLIGKGENVNV